MASLLMLLVVAVGAKGDVASPLEFQFQNTVGWNHLGTSVYAGNNLTVAYNGSHTHVLDASTLPKGMEVQDAGYWAWQLVEITNGGPSARDGHAMASLGDGRLLMYGGSDNDNNVLNDSWLFEFSLFLDIGIWVGTWTRTKDGPNARRGHAMSPLENGKALMYGGRGVNNFLNDASIFQLSSLSFNIDDGAAASPVGTWIPAKDGPSARELHAMAPLEDGRVLLFGGWDATLDGNIFNDCYIFELSSPSLNIDDIDDGIDDGKNGAGTWTRATKGPSARRSHAMASLGDGTVLMYGGWDGKTLLADAWEFELGTWTKKKPLGKSAREDQIMTSLGNGKVLMYGGWDGFTKKNDAWIFDRAAVQGSYSPWTRTNDGPSIRRSFALATLDNGRVMVFGGITFGWFGNVDLNDAWLFELSPFSNIEDGNNGAVGTVRFGLRFC